MPRDPTEQLRDALDEVVAFLADRKPPALVVDSVETLAATKPELLAAEIRTWADEQHRIRRGAVPVHHLLLHALAKLQVFDDLEMLRGDRFRRYLEQVTVLLHDSAPPEEREAFLAGLVDPPAPRRSTSC